ncbi:MAG: hypothetical protein IPM38_03985 [Ignavibacteria bacterium]|nr:hypothetical protein [Ignavibacteria bacterium]
MFISDKLYSLEFYQENLKKCLTSYFYNNGRVEFESGDIIKEDIDRLSENPEIFIKILESDNILKSLPSLYNLFCSNEFTKITDLFSSTDFNLKFRFPLKVIHMDLI